MLNNYFCRIPLESTLLRNSLQTLPWEISETSKKCPQLFRFMNLSITIKSNKFAGKKYRCLIFWRSKETRRVNSCLTYCSQKKKKMNNKHYQVFLILSGVPKSLQMKLRVKFRADDLRRTYCGCFPKNLLMLWWSIFDGININGIAIFRKTFIQTFLAQYYLPGPETWDRVPQDPRPRIQDPRTQNPRLQDPQPRI